MKDNQVLTEYAIYQAIHDLETYCRHRPAGGYMWLQVESEDRATVPVIKNALLVLKAAGIEIIRDKPKYPNIRIVYDRAGNRFFNVKGVVLTIELSSGNPQQTIKNKVYTNDLSAELDLTSDEQQPFQSFGIIDPDYARVFTKIRILAWSYGYACLAHGTFTRDLDLLLVPWAAHCAKEHDALIKYIADVCGLKIQGDASDKPHGRKAWTLRFSDFGDPRWIDISVFTMSNY